MSSWHWILITAAMAALTVTVEVRAQQTPPPTPTTSATPSHWIDRWYERITRRFNRTVDAVDSYFAQYEPVEPERESQLRVQTWLQHEDGEVTFEPRVRVDVEMPNLQHRLNVYIDNLEDNLLPGSDPVKADESVRLGARGDFFRGGRWVVTRDLGVRFSSGIKPYAEVAGHYRWYWGQWDGTLSQSLFWNRDDDFGGLSRAVLDRKLTPVLYARLISAAKYTQDHAYLGTSLVGKLGWVVTEREQYLIGSVAMLGKSRLVDEYRTELTYRVRVYRPWIFIELTPYYSFPRDQEFTRTPGFRVGLDLFFGGVPKL